MKKFLRTHDLDSFEIITLGIAGAVGAIHVIHYYVSLLCTL